LQPFSPPSSFDPFRHFALVFSLDFFKLSPLHSPRILNSLSPRKPLHPCSFSEFTPPLSLIYLAPWSMVPYRLLFRGRRWIFASFSPPPRSFYTPPGNRSYPPPPPPFFFEKKCHEALIGFGTPIHFVSLFFFSQASPSGTPAFSSGWRAQKPLVFRTPSSTFDNYFPGLIMTVPPLPPLTADVICPISSVFPTVSSSSPGYFFFWHIPPFLLFFVPTWPCSPCLPPGFFFFGTARSGSRYPSSPPPTATGSLSFAARSSYA